MTPETVSQLQVLFNLSILCTWSSVSAASCTESCTESNPAIRSFRYSVTVLPLFSIMLNVLVSSLTDTGLVFLVLMFSNPVYTCTNTELSWFFTIFYKKVYTLSTMRVYPAFSLCALWLVYTPFHFFIKFCGVGMGGGAARRAGGGGRRTRMRQKHCLWYPTTPLYFAVAYKKITGIVWLWYISSSAPIVSTIRKSLV